MKNLVHCFSRKVVSKFLDSLEEKPPFELIAAVMLQRLYEEQWRAPTTIGFYMTAKYADLLEASDVPDQNLVIEALRCGRKENSEIDFVLVSEEGNSLAEFQLKRFGLGNLNNTTESLIAYLNEMERRYAPTEATLLVALAEFELIDFPRVRDEVKRDRFPFSELLLIGVASDKFLVAGILPNEGWSAYDLAWVVKDPELSGHS
jgi:hypothetical protein